MEFIKNIKKFFREKFNFLRILLIFIVFLLIFFLIIFIYLFTGEASQAEKIDWGITFSKPFAEQLSLDWKNAYLAMLDDLGVRKLRLIAYWPEIEKNRNEYIFNDLDWQIQEAGKRNAEVILVMGRKTPRWPECHIPEWANELSESEQQTEILDLINNIILHYKDNKIIKYWQVENEPFLHGFGECPKLDKKFLDKEIALVNNLDSRQVILTTSGELSLWSQPASRTSILGTTLYRIVWSDTFGLIRYPIPPVFYYKRANLTKKIFNLDKVFVIELQGEPWWPKQIYETPIDKQFWSMNIIEFKKTLDYAKRTGLDEFYLWGAEWWYWLKINGHDNDFWGEAQKLWQ